MIRFELKKIFGRKLNLAAMLVGLLVFGGILLYQIAGYSYYDSNRDAYLTGLEAFSLAAGQEEYAPSLLTEEFMTEYLENIQAQNLKLGSEDAYMKIIRQNPRLFYFAAESYTDIRADYVDEEVLNEIDLSGGAKFYERRMEKITDYLTTDYSSGNFSGAEKEYWIGKASQVETPFAWGNQDVMNVLLDMATAGIYLIFVVIFCVSPIFSSEREIGTEALLLTTKYGCSRLVWSKLAAAFLFTTGYYLASYLLCTAAVGVLLGFPGADLPIQLWNAVIPYCLTVMQAYLLHIGMILLISLTVTSVVCLFAAWSKSTVAAMAVGILAVFAPLFFPMSKTSGLWNHINYLFPIRGMLFQEVLGTYASFSIGKLVIPYPWMLLLVNGMVIVLAAVPVKRLFQKMR